MLQNTVNTQVYKKYGLVIPGETIEHVRNINMAPDFSGQTPMETFHTTKNSDFWKFRKIRKFLNFRKANHSTETSEMFRLRF